MDNENIQSEPVFNTELKIIITQAICIILIAVTLSIVRFAFPSIYGKFKDKYNKEIMTDTKISEVLSNGNEN